MTPAKCFVVIGGRWMRMSVIAGKFLQARGHLVHWI